MIKPKRSLGQNFLVNSAVIKKITRTVKELKPKFLIEIGPGTGALTHELLQLSVPLVLIELDRELADQWRKAGQNVIEGDALQINWSELVKHPGTVIVSNLPYQIASSFVIDRSVAHDENVKAMVLMFQKEVAQRLLAKKSTSEYGMLSVMAQIFWTLETVCDAGPKSFQPAPKVAARVLKFLPKKNPVSKRQEFLNFLKKAFSQRRKLLRKNLGIDNDKMISLGFKENVRAQELAPDEWLELYHLLVG